MKRGARAFIALGGNLGDPRAAMRLALDRIDADRDTAVVGVSSLYRTPPWGKTDQPDFLNAVAGVETRLSPRGLLDLCLSTEEALRRVRGERWGPRTIDLDLLCYDDAAIAEPGLEVPHPRLTERAFVLVPLAEIAPGLIVKGRTVAEWLRLAETAGIEKENDPGWWR